MAGASNGASRQVSSSSNPAMLGRSSLKKSQKTGSSRAGSRAAGFVMCAELPERKCNLLYVPRVQQHRVATQEYVKANRDL